MKWKQITMLLILFLMSISIVGAAFNYKGENLARIYTSGEKIRGTINMSFTNENAHNILKSNFNGTITLIDLLRANNFEEIKDYNCTKKNCSADYEIGGSTSSITLSGGEAKTIDFKITGSGVEITSLKLSLTSDKEASCSRQLLIDVLDKNESYFQNMKGTSNACIGKYIGCFDSSAAGDNIAIITKDSYYCEKIELPPAPAYRIGAKIKKGTQGELKMQLRDIYFNMQKECTLPQPTQDGEIDCQANYSSTIEKEFFVCIYSTSSNCDHGIRMEQSGEKCGTATESEPYTTDFEIYAKTIEFAPVGIITINETTFADLNDGASLREYVGNYILDKYDGNCSLGCVVPFKISGESQNIGLSNAELRYLTGEGISHTTSTIYMTEKKDSKVTTKTLNIDIEKAGFTIPIASNAMQLLLYLNNQAILPKPITISIIPGFEFDVVPKIVYLGILTKFYASTGANITSSSWVFGDGKSASPNDKTTSHKYVALPATGNQYDMDVTLTRSDGISSRRTFKIILASLSDSANKVAEECTKRLSNITAQIASYPLWKKSKIEEKLNLGGMNSTIIEKKASIGDATTDSEYVNAITALVNLNVPYEISVKEKGNDISPLVGFENLDIKYIEEISNEQVEGDDEELLKKAIVGWMINNTDTKINYEKVYAIGDEGQGILFTAFKINIAPKGDEEIYLVINYAKDSITFGGNYSEQSVGGSGTYIPIRGQSTIEFLIGDNIDVADIGTYVSPKVSDVFAQAELYEEPGFKWGGFITLMIILLLAAFAAYIALQEWYKKYYEGSLFKKKEDIYNVINFIYNSRKAGIGDNEIKKKLGNAGWKGEQINYAFKKTDGKRAGMWEIPIFKFWEQRKIKQEIAKRQAQKQAPQQNLLKK